MSDAFLIASTCIHACFIVLFIFRFGQLRAVPYVFVALAITLYLFADVIALLIPAYVSDKLKFDRYNYGSKAITFSSTPEEEVRAHLLYLVASAMAIVGNLFFDLVVVFLLGCWINSMKVQALVPRAQNLLIWAHRCIVSSYVAYPVLSTAILVGVGMVEFYTPRGSWVILGAKVLYGVNWISQIVAVSWLYFTFFIADKNYCREKYRQLTVLILLTMLINTFFNAGVYWNYIASMVIFWLRCVVALWPKALVGHSRSPRVFSMSSKQLKEAI